MSQELIWNNESSTGLTFEDLKKENGIIYWWATDLMVTLGYSTMASFQKAIDRTVKALMTLDIDHYQQIIHKDRIVNGKEIKDYKLTRFACYMVTMNADSKKIEVAAAQAFFATQTRKFQLIMGGSEEIDRLLYREELKGGQSALATAAKDAGVQDYAQFQNAGYLGLYNNTAGQLEKLRGLKPKELMDHMGRAELAANLFRVTQTEQKLKLDQIKGEYKAKTVHNEVARRIRSMVKENTGKFPEELPVEKRLPDIRKNLKQGKKEFDKIDKK